MHINIKSFDELKRKKFFITDIHGAYKALLQCLERSNFDYDKDILIIGGDICDGWSEVYECIEEFLKIKHVICILGNHDDAFIHWMNRGTHPWGWLQGASATAESYIRNSERKEQLILIPHEGAFLTNLTYFDIPFSHREFFAKMKPYFIDPDNRLFIHAGLDRRKPIEEQSINTLLWDRTFIQRALCHKEKNHKFKVVGNFKEIYLGHTTTQLWKRTIPMKGSHVYNLDTGAGWTGKATIMNIDTKEYWQSDKVSDLYPNEYGRRGYKLKKKR